MAVSNEDNLKRVHGAGTTPTIGFLFRVLQSSDLKVYKILLSTGVAVLQTEGVDYDVELEDDGEGGNVVFLASVSALYDILIVNQLALVQAAKLPTEGNFNETSVETALDRCILINIQQQEQIKRGLKLTQEDPLNTTGYAGLFIKSETVAHRASRVLQWNDAGDEIETGLLAESLEDLEAIADDISAVAAIASAVVEVAGISASVSTVAGISANVTTVANIAGDIATVVANITDIQNAEENADAAEAASRPQPEDVAGTTYTLVIGDENKTKRCTNASAVALTVPPNSSVAFPLGARVFVEQAGAGQITITPGAGVTLDSKYSRLKSEAQYSMITLYKRATDTWIVMGELTT